MRALRRRHLLDSAFDRAAVGVEAGERGWLRELVYGTVRLRGRIDHHLAGRVRRGLDSVDPDVLDTLRLGTYQLLEMGSVPPYAAISESVELVRWAGVPRAAGFVNGVLRGLHRERDRLAPPAGWKETPEGLARWGSHPRWLVDRWVGRWGRKEAAALLEANNRRPFLYINPIGMTASRAAGLLAERGVEAAEVPAVPGSLRLPADARLSEVLETVPAVVQDPAAALVVEYAALPAEGRVLDLCAAPGGKAAALAGSGPRVTAMDRAPSRLERVVENVTRLGLSDRMDVLAGDATAPPFAERSADAVLLDVPCSGTGTLGRHPDGRWRLAPQDIEALAELQRRILDGGARLVRPGGLLVYATCSLEEEENTVQVEDFLKRTPEFVPEPVPDVVDDRFLDEAGRLEVVPQRSGFDGSFAVRMRRAG